MRFKYSYYHRNGQASKGDHQIFKSPASHEIFWGLRGSEGYEMGLIQHFIFIFLSFFLSLLLLHPFLHVFPPVITLQVGHPDPIISLRNKKRESSPHLFLTREILSAASCRASFSLSNRSFFVQARIALTLIGFRGNSKTRISKLVRYCPTESPT